MKFLGIYLACALILANVIMAEDDPLPEDSRKFTRVEKRPWKDLKPDSNMIARWPLHNRKTVQINLLTVMISIIFDHHILSSMIF